MPPRPPAASPIAARHDAGVGDVARDRERARAGLLGGVDQPVMPAGEQRQLAPR